MLYRLYADIATVQIFLFTIVTAGLWPAPLSQHPLRPEIELQPSYKPYNLSVPVDHFHNDSRYEPHSNASFDLRYYFDASYYQLGGPVVILHGGESDVEERLPYLQNGIAAQIANATGGISVILEHRYYGTSFPVPNLSTENFRFLTTDQALADAAFFQKNAVFPGLEHLNLTAPGTPYIHYGGSYAGGFASFLRKLYPESTWAAISSSGVTVAHYDFWQYEEPIRQYGPPDCISAHTKLISIIDNILLGNNNDTKLQLKDAFNVTTLTEDVDFGRTLGYGITGWQGRNWDPAINSPSFDRYCNNLTAATSLYPNLALPNITTIESLISSGGWSNSTSQLTRPMLNLIAWYKVAILSRCNTSSSSLNECFGHSNTTSEKYMDRRLTNYGRLSWPYQYCTQWGYLQSGSTLPPNLLPIISRTITLEHTSAICRRAFNITTPSNVSEINKYGGYNFTYPRLATLGGQTDPWRSVSPLADVPLIEGATSIVNNTSTLSEPIIVIEGAVHHWDENGVFQNETTPEFPPKPVRDAKQAIINAAMDWMVQWRSWCALEDNKGVCNNLT